MRTHFVEFLPIAQRKFRTFFLDPLGGCFLDGHIALVEPKLGNVHDPILLGKLLHLPNGKTVQVEENDVTLSIYNSEGVSSPLGGQIPPSGFAHTIISDTNYQKARSLSTLERWLLAGGTIVSFPGDSLAFGE